MNLFKIQPLTADLLPAVVELDDLCFGGLWTLEGYTRELDSPNSDLLVVSVATSSSDGDRDLTPTLIGLGCVWAIVDEAHITLLAVRPGYQKRGLGTALFVTLLQTSWRRGLKQATLEVRASNHAALSLYQKFGFQEAGRRRGYYADTGEDALILWRGGLQHPQFETTLMTWKQQIHHRTRSKNWVFIE
ncbi:ribosomal protein S18-alanine N-acetyltransferase [Oscillatoriales cyanobacterium LEGE 11467]|uniref:Ribosomal protein S18-alanine N-acetyltransferase n=1 Tax=Zarconia navalis LEGE 11467 TaxID=1828826 RepID=A0A928ZAR3_9CYAN|nr:ribosomal protein S18-alanine N-acetyltransferase [Zarconia navalis]MBE9041921.1 ribosomal protein S18-alanine N-acetyltransferase [Zarconia navalis LEGE 11467]